MVNGNGNNRRARRNGARTSNNNNRNTTTTPMRGGKVVAPMQFAGRAMRPMKQGIEVLTGSDFLGNVQAKAGVNINNASDRVLRSFPVTPSGYPGTRITQMSELWERYRFRKFTLRYVPAVPTTLACQFLMYVDTDPLDDPRTITSDEALIRQGVAQAGAQQWNFIAPQAVNMAMRSDDQLYYTGADEANVRFSQAGKAHLLQITNPLDFGGVPLTTDIVCGALWLDWEVCFQVQQINPGIGTFLRSTANLIVAATGRTGFSVVGNGPGWVFPTLMEWPEPGVTTIEVLDLFKEGGTIPLGNWDANVESRFIGEPFYLEAGRYEFENRATLPCDLTMSYVAHPSITLDVS